MHGCWVAPTAQFRFSDVCGYKAITPTGYDNGLALPFVMLLLPNFLVKKAKKTIFSATEAYFCASITKTIT
jgi:hypothetical protein